MRGIAAVVTGGGKTIFALNCIGKAQPRKPLIVVPTTALADQWADEAAAHFNLQVEDIHFPSSKWDLKHGTINIGTMQSLSRNVDESIIDADVLVVDECHRIASPEYRKILNISAKVRLGLSATPNRQYDDGLSDVLIPGLGSVIYNYGYKEAKDDGVIVDFILRNILFNLEVDRQNEFDRLTKRIIVCSNKFGDSSPEVVKLLLQRSRVNNQSPTRVELAAKIAARHVLNKTIVFLEDIESSRATKAVLEMLNIKASLYHSELSRSERIDAIRSYRSGCCNTIIACRALDEGFNAPETEVAIIAASSATVRQRVQRLGRTLRPSPGKDVAVIYTLASTKSEVARLVEEEDSYKSISQIEWYRS